MSLSEGGYPVEDAVDCDYSRPLDGFHSSPLRPRPKASRLAGLGLDVLIVRYVDTRMK